MIFKIKQKIIRRNERERNCYFPNISFYMEECTKLAIKELKINNYKLKTVINYEKLINLKLVYESIIFKL